MLASCSSEPASVRLASGLINRSLTTLYIVFDLWQHNSSIALSVEAAGVLADVDHNGQRHDLSRSL